MAVRETKTLTKKPETLSKKSDSEEVAPEQFTQRRRPELGQFRLQVDRQTKGSYATAEAAETAGRAIKKSHPVVHVTVYDTVKSTNTIIELP